MTKIIKNKMMFDMPKKIKDVLGIHKKDWREEALYLAWICFTDVKKQNTLKIALNRFSSLLSKHRNIKSIILFGSFCTGEYVPTRSDLDLIIVFNNSADFYENINTLSYIALCNFRSFYLRYYLEPYVFSNDDITKYPIDPFFNTTTIENISKKYIVLYGEDVVKRLKPSSAEDVQVDYYFYRYWLRRKITTPTLLIHIPFIVKTSSKMLKFMCRNMLEKNMIDKQLYLKTIDLINKSLRSTIRFTYSRTLFKMLVKIYWFMEMYADAYLYGKKVCNITFPEDDFIDKLYEQYKIMRRFATMKTTVDMTDLEMHSIDIW